jgi:hypothetical protein
MAANMLAEIKDQSLLVRRCLKFKLVRPRLTIKTTNLRDRHPSPSWGPARYGEIMSSRLTYRDYEALDTDEGSPEGSAVSRTSSRASTIPIEEYDDSGVEI